MRIITLQHRSPDATAAATSRKALRIVLVVGVCIVGAIGLGPSWITHPILALTNWLVALAFGITSLLFFDESGQRSTAWLFLGASACWIAGYVGGLFQVGPLPLIQWIGGPLVFPILAVIMLRYPDRRLHDKAQRLYVTTLLCWLLTLLTITAATVRPEWLGYNKQTWWPVVAPSKSLSQFVITTYQVGALALAFTFAVLMILRLRSAFGLDRRMVNPIVVGASASCCVVIIEVATEMLPSAVIAPLQAAILAVEAAVFLVIPTAFLVAALRRRLARSAVADLVINMSRSGTGETVRTALREALCDSELDVLYWVPDVNAYVDPNGTVLADGQVSNAQLGRKQWPLSVESSDGKPLAAVVLDESLKNHPDLVDAAVAAAQLALERAQLQASNRVQIEEVRASRTRLIEAGVAERRRLERDLHDGAQQRLLALNLTLAAARVGAVDPEQVRFIDGIRSELHSTLTELRELAHGIHPALLAQAGLGPAVISVAERLPIDVSVDIPHLKMPPAVEATAYYLVCEAMVNATKHAAAGHVFVQAHRLGPDLMVEISDDGSGGARLSAGTGLAGLQDRVVALGGSFTIASPSDKGTRILARIPCG